MYAFSQSIESMMPLDEEQERENPLNLRTYTVSDQEVQNQGSKDVPLQSMFLHLVVRTSILALGGRILPCILICFFEFATIFPLESTP